jgi:predicted nucleotidyltransferase
MRLTREEAETIRTVLRRAFGAHAEVWLFGSRTDDALSGGDIDLYVETPLDQGLVEAKLDALGELRRAMGDQRFDLVVRPLPQRPTAFQKLAKAQGVPL